MKPQRLLYSAIFSTLILSGCQAPPPSDSIELRERIVVLEQKVEGLEALQQRVAKLESEKVAMSEQTKPSAEKSVEEPVSAEPTPEAEASEPVAALNESGSLLTTVDFSKYPSSQRLKEIVSFGFLPKANIQEPEDLESEITRGQYVAMLVEMNNFMFDGDSGKNIRLARDSDQTFTDVPTDHPQYKYIQGMVDAGYVIGFNETTFQPDKTLTREEMVAIAAKRDYDFSRGSKEYHWKNTAKWTDKEDIAPKYRDAFALDIAKRAKSNIKQAFGDAKLLKPKQNVRAYEAILSLYKIGNHGDYGYNKKVKERLGE